MIIGVDIDGVLAQVHEWYLDDVAKYFLAQGKPIIDATAYSATDMFGVTREQANEYWDTAIWRYAKDVEVIDGAAEYMAMLKKDGHTIIINTARWLSNQDDKDGERMRALVRKWLLNHKIPYDKLVFAEFGGGNKMTSCRENNIDVHIEDSPKEIELVAPHTPVIIFEQPYNRDFNIQNTHRARSWRDVHDYINKIKTR
ncbi:MAG: hypothetical protein FWC00_03140 [Firmicutes bacterium]|nr:hypothetical protein [Bacillota bacterium]